MTTSAQYFMPLLKMIRSLFPGQLFSFGRGVQWTNSGRAICLTDTDCDPDGATGEVCWRLYDGCTYGKCMCDPRTHLLEAGRCLLGTFGAAAIRPAINFGTFYYVFLQCRTNNYYNMTVSIPKSLSINTQIKNRIIST